MHPDVAAYLDKAPPDQRPTLEKLREMIVQRLPDAEESIQSGFPVYARNGTWLAGFATRKKGPMLYIMAAGVLDRYVDRLGKLRSGRSCVEFRPSENTTIDELEELAGRMLDETAGVSP
jgi:uncharacterized protein YdhG (YjbR/CyaY superfamily)